MNANREYNFFFVQKKESLVTPKFLIGLATKHDKRALSNEKNG